MKKLLLLWLLCFSIFPVIKQNQLSFSTIQATYAQCDCHNNTNDPVKRQSIWDWLLGVVRKGFSLITDFLNWIDDLFDGGGTSGGSNNEPPTNLPDIYLTWGSVYSSAVTIPDEPIFRNYGGSGNYNSIDPNLLPMLNQNMEWPDPPPGAPVYDCENVANGRAFIDNCGTCVGGYTGLIPCYVPPPRFDTVRPIPIPCPDTNSVKRNTRLNSQPSKSGFNFGAIKFQ